MEVSLGLLRDSQANQPDGMRASGRTSLRFSSEAVFDSRERSDSQLEVTVNNCSPSAHVLTSHPAESKDTVSTCALQDSRLCLLHHLCLYSNPPSLCCPSYSLHSSFKSAEPDGIGDWAQAAAPAAVQLGHRPRGAGNAAQSPRRPQVLVRYSDRRTDSESQSVRQSEAHSVRQSDRQHAYS